MNHHPDTKVQIIIQPETLAELEKIMSLHKFDTYDKAIRFLMPWQTKENSRRGEDEDMVEIAGNFFIKKKTDG